MCKDLSPSSLEDNQRKNELKPTPKFIRRRTGALVRVDAICDHLAGRNEISVVI